MRLVRFLLVIPIAIIFLPAPLSASDYVGQYVDRNTVSYGHPLDSDCSSGGWADGITRGNAGYGTAYNQHSNPIELMMRTICHDDGFTALIGSGVSTNDAYMQYNFAVYNTGYHWTGSTWAPIYFQPNTSIGFGSGAYIYGRAKSSSIIPYTGDQTYWVAFFCLNTAGGWKCGCTDAACTTPSWNLQVIGKKIRMPYQQ